ncbi:hypothetical protein GH714_019377 [Hevea brasiliensis]|uniref:F-actin-capping protein subunit beta n=1 Tax=Hevea brasiliensis TaxID=3981 RepID=A0A6A6KPV8_HEVBR|nr:hypothetical protein GH714_019377 [Hevea brasiliensis]
MFSLKIEVVLCDVDCGKEFILCEYNRDADSYRSPWSNKYHPPLEDAPYPSSELRKLEIEANEVFAIYRDHLINLSAGRYYEGGISSVYLWEDDDSEGGARRRRNSPLLFLTSTVMLSLTTNDESSGTFSLSGSIRRQMNMDLAIADGHLCNMEG